MGAAWELRGNCVGTARKLRGNFAKTESMICLSPSSFATDATVRLGAVVGGTHTELEDDDGPPTM